MWWAYELIFTFFLFVAHIVEDRVPKNDALSRIGVFPGDIEVGVAAAVQGRKDSEEEKEEEGYTSRRIEIQDGRKIVSSQRGLTKRYEQGKTEIEMGGADLQQDDGPREQWGWDTQELSSNWEDDPSWTIPDDSYKSERRTNRQSSDYDNKRSRSPRLHTHERPTHLDSRTRSKVFTPKVKTAFCHPCHRVFPHLVALKQHEAAVHLDQPSHSPRAKHSVDMEDQSPVCDVCLEMFSLRLQVRQHKKAKHPWSLLCSTHLITFPNAFMALKHYQRQHGCKDVPALRIQEVLDELKANSNRNEPADELDIQRPLICGECNETFLSAESLHTHSVSPLAHSTKDTDNSLHFPPLPMAPASVLSPKHLVDQFDTSMTYGQIDVDQDLPSFDFPDLSNLPSSDASGPSLSEQSVDVNLLSPEHTGEETAMSNNSKMAAQDAAHQLNIAAVSRMAGDHSASQVTYNRSSRTAGQWKDHNQSTSMRAEPITRPNRSSPPSRSATFHNWIAHEDVHLPSFEMPTQDKPFAPYSDSEPSDSTLRPLSIGTIPRHVRARPTPRVASVTASAWTKPLAGATPIAQAATLKDIAIARKGKVKMPKVDKTAAIQPIFDSGWTQVPTTLVVGARTMGGQSKKVDDSWGGVSTFVSDQSQVVVSGEEDPYGGW
ncbi:hypothetical protein BCR39DRAFT_545007 [Naematelia encephala]|uniref:C2H2-type domain-containing protein n=1 Tax=Naematelia encephala TaxID=71784 RepID=A0A1Y2ART2_9TREE|nr:hypothetical protein BCR39DRAFT_545007 [Naematelia encephala]